jgi:beta-carotene hydroxylase
MLPRYTSDYRTLFWALVLFPVVPALGYARPALLPWLVPIALYTSYCTGVLTHNHTHVPVFRARWANDAFGAWLSIFYGCPIAAWIPTHLENHHRHLDGPEDVTRTSRRSPKHDLWQALVYTTACANWQRPLIAGYVRRSYARRGRHWRVFRNQAATLVVTHAGMLALSLALHGAAGILVYVLAFGLPAVLAPSFMQFTNYIQHVHCDPASADNHSRNFVDRTANWFLFDGGYHTVHHERPSTHWSRYAELHRERASRIHPSLCRHSVLSFCFETYVLGAFCARFRTRPLAELPTLPLASALGPATNATPRHRALSLAPQVTAGDS